MASFQIKDFASISASMINIMKTSQRKVTDFNPGSINRTMLEAPASEMDELYQQMLNGLLQAIPVSVYNSFSFSALPAEPASGLVTVNIASQLSPTTLVSGTIFTATTNGNTYTLESDQIIPTGVTSINVTCVATAPGSSTNLSGGTTFSVSPQPSGFTSASNPNSFINGTDAETPAQQLIRFNGYITTLQGATDDAIIYGAKTTTLTDSSGNVIERVATAIVVEPYLTNNTLPISSIFCYVHNGVGGTSVSLVAQAQNVINGFTNPAGVRIRGYKAAGVICTVAACTEQPVNVTGVLTAVPGFVAATLMAQAASVISAYLLSLEAGAKAQFSLIETLVILIPGVADFVIGTPTANVAATAANYKIMPGVIAIT